MNYLMAGKKQFDLINIIFIGHCCLGKANHSLVVELSGNGPIRQWVVNH